MLIINSQKITKTNISGAGGKEDVIMSLFENKLIRVSRPLYDFVDEQSQIKYEIKKQKDLQWLDPSKYHILSDDDRLITMLFVCYDSSGFVDLIYTCSLGDMVDREYTKNVISACNALKNIDSSIQTKKGFKTRHFINNNHDICSIVYLKDV